MWHDLPANRNVRDYPLLIDDEFGQKVAKGLIDFDIFKKIIDEIKGKVYAVRMSFRGEALLHKQFIDMVSYAKRAGIREGSTLTNGSKLNGD